MVVPKVKSSFAVCLAALVARCGSEGGRDEPDVAVFDLAGGDTGSPDADAGGGGDGGESDAVGDPDLTEEPSPGEVPTEEAETGCPNLSRDRDTDTYGDPAERLSLTSSRLARPPLELAPRGREEDAVPW